MKFYRSAPAKSSNPKSNLEESLLRQPIAIFKILIPFPARDSLRPYAECRVRVRVIPYFVVYRVTSETVVYV